MKILEVVFHLQSGGAERFVVDLSNELAKTVDVTLLTLRDDKVNSDARLFYKDDLSSAVKYDNLGLKDGLSLLQWWKIYKKIKDLNPDVVHFHGGPMPIWMYVPMLLSSRKIRFYQTIHSDVHNGYDKGIYKLMYHTLAKKKKIQFIALSQTNNGEFCRIYPKSSCVCILNGRAPITPTKKFKAVEEEVNSFRRNSETRIFLHVARCNPVKNQNRLVRAFNSFVAKGYNAELLIVGDNFDSELGKQIQSCAGPHVHFLGTRKNIADYHLCSDVFCLSSDFEGMPITILEALLSGTPVVSTPVCGAIDVIREGENGVLARGYSDEEYLDALEKIYRELPEIAEQATAQKGTGEYTINNCAEKYLSFFKE